MTGRTDSRGWRIQSRQLGIAGFGGHNYLVLVDAQGQVREALHGWGNKTGKISRIHIKDGTIVAGARPEFLEKIDAKPKIEGADVEVPLNGRDAREVWNDFLKTGDSHHNLHRYDWTGAGYDPKTGEPFYNSNSFWRSVLEENDYDWRQLQPKSSQVTPGTGRPLPPAPERRAAVAADPMNRSIDTWTDDDVSKVMRSNAYWSSAYPENRPMHEKVRAWHVRKYDGPGGGGRSGGGGGPVHVSAHVCAGAQVSDYTRARPSR